MAHELSCPKIRVVGTKQVLRYAKASMLGKVYIAKDADEEIIGKLKSVCENNGITYDMSHTMHQIGSACGIEVGSACAAVLKSANG
ncbi:MAG: ribosomal L7Ae/L30e/S12e/Gadd45 family protein [Eubacteriales bacterium]|nr:ribosomal L7Ae/L30e/S12e/Gadd45 family protein [Eubacteriales bacterium]